VSPSQHCIRRQRDDRGPALLSGVHGTAATEQESERRPANLLPVPFIDPGQPLTIVKKQLDRIARSQLFTVEKVTESVTDLFQLERVRHLLQVRSSVGRRPVYSSCNCVVALWRSIAVRQASSDELSLICRVIAGTHRIDEMTNSCTSLTWA